jgi:2-polyprenyl-6-methoxyphenol hydroxylase-like FAD-dependent oxidoreductase
MKAVIVGGGIGGLTTALMLHQAGIEVQVYESVPEVKPAGVGINLLPHAVKRLDRLGLLDELYAVAIPTESLTFFNKFGQKIWSEPRGLGAGYRWPQFSIHRGELQVILHKTAVARLGEHNVRTGHHFETYENGADGIVAQFRDTAHQKLVEVKADVLIGADGIHSTVRERIHPEEGPPVWSGIVMWRATTEMEPFMGGRAMIMAGTPPHKFVCYPMSVQAEREGRSLVNWIADIRIGGVSPYKRENWTQRARMEDVLKYFADWKFDWLDIATLVSKAGTVYEYPLMDREPFARWTDGRATLLGDAAHPMYPMGSNGSSQAILDAEAITAALLAEPRVEKALERYESERRPATAAVVLANRQSGPERVMKLADDLAPDGFDDVDKLIPYAERLAIADDYKRLAGFDVATVNAD